MTLQSFKAFLAAILTIFFLNSVQLKGNVNYSFKHFNINNGLSQNTVFSIFQDNQGFMWFGTKDGLNRFDGSSFKIFRFSPNGSLRDNIFHRIIQDQNNQIWVGTEDGVYIYDTNKEEFIRFKEIAQNGEIINGVVSDMIMDTDGDIWMCIEGKGVYHYSFSSMKLIFFDIQVRPEGMKMMSICQGKDGNIWVLPYSRPILRINKKTKQISEFNLVDDEMLFNDMGVVTSVLADQYHQLIIGTSQKGLIEINTITKTHRLLLENDKNSMPVYVRAVTRIDPHRLWVGTESGVYIYDEITGKVEENLRHNYFISYSLSDNAIYSIYKDRDDGIWIGSYFGGVDYYSENLNKFELFYPVPMVNNMRGIRVREFYPSNNGNLWIGTEDGGLNLFDPIKNEFLDLPQLLQSLYTNIHALYQDGDYLWISTFSQGLNRYNLRTNELVTYVHSNDSNSINHNSTFSICKDRQNVLWIGTLLGLNIYNYHSDDFTNIDELRGLSIFDIFEDSDGLIWISTFSNGLYRLNPADSTWKVFTNDPNISTSLPYNKVTNVFEDSNNKLWVATQGGGFSFFDKETDTFTTFNTTNGMPNDVVYQIEEDLSGSLWLSTNSGLVCFDPQKITFRNYTVGNGLKTNQFNYKSSFRAIDGTLYFGSVDGFVRFDPSKFNTPGNKQPIVITELFINNNPVHPFDENSPLKQSILNTEILELPYSMNSFSLRYALLDYSNQNVSRVSYKLEGFDKEWVESRGKQNIIYSNLKPGKYLLTLKLNNNNEGEEQTENIKTVTILIKPPFWLSRWAYLIYTVLFISSIVALVRYLEFRNQKIQRRKMRIFEQQRERELYRSKIDFFTNVAHEIRTPLSLIKAPLDFVIMTERVSDNVKENLQIMSKNTNRLLNLINQLLDFRKTESDAYLLNLETHNVSELIRETFSRFTPIVKQRSLLFELDLPENDMYVKVDKEAFIKIISNLFNNAIKYSDSFVRLKAYISTDGSESLFHLITENDGETIREENKDDIFKPFVKIDKESDQKMTGTGIGLALSRSLTELHSGSLDIEDSEQWIRFHLKLPVGDLVLTESDQSNRVTNKKNGDEVKKSASSSVVLFVDDDRDLSHFVEKLLSPNYHVLLATDGLQALDLLKNNNVNIIVSDVMMPEMDGFELAQRVKSDIEFCHIPIILLTAKANVESKVQGFKTGADAYIDKPFSVEILLAQIANLLQNREKLRETFLKHPFIGATSVALTKSDEDFINKLNTLVHDNLDNSDFNVEGLAEQFNMSRASFYRKIKGVLDLTPNEYIRLERLKEAARLLKEKDLKVNEICYMVGFNSPSYFTKCFQQQFGILPKDFE